MKVISYLSSLPAKSLLPHTLPGNQKAQTLAYYSKGVINCGDGSELISTMQYRPSDVAVILGWVHENSKSSPHLQFRREIVERQREHGGRTVIIDSNLFLYHDTNNYQQYLRYSYDGVFPDTGEYCDQTPQPERWSEIQKNTGLVIQPWREVGTHVLLCLQRDGGWSMNGKTVVSWAMDVINTLRRYTTRPIRIRPHPGDRSATAQCQKLLVTCQTRGIKDISTSVGHSSLIDDLRDCWAVVNHNSSPTVGAAIMGVPVFLTDPQRSQARDIANTDLSLIENPLLPNRQQWLERISMFHWNHADLLSGRCWQHMKQWAKR